MKKFKENIFPIPRQDFSYSDTSSEHQRSSRLTPKPRYIRIIHLKSFILLKLNFQCLTLTPQKIKLAPNLLIECRIIRSLYHYPYHFKRNWKLF